MLATATRTRRRTITPAQARSELARRELARRDLLQFGLYVDDRFLPYRHTKLVAEALMKVERFIATEGKEGIGRLMIFMPPQNGKTEMVSIKFPAWMFGRHPDLRIIEISYGANLSSLNSRKVRNLVNDCQYQAVFGLKSTAEDPIQLSSDSRSVSSWNLAQPSRGGMDAAGIDGAVTGKGAGLLIIDDPFKNRKEADSEERRNDVDDFYRSSAVTRLAPWGAVVNINTRWHQDDLSGRLIQRSVEDPSADQWTILSLPALALEEYPTPEKQLEMMREGVYLPTSDPLQRKPGEALWPEQYNAEWLLNKRANTLAYEFEALYQQMPYLKEGEVFRRAWLNKIIPALPEGVTLRQVVFYFDKAGSSKGDYTAGVLMALGSDGYFYVLDVLRGRWQPHERDQEMRKGVIEATNRYGVVKIWHQRDPASAGLDSALATNRLFTGFPVRFEPATGSKEDRADPFASACQGDLVRLLKGAWNQAFIDELCAFPRGRYDDQVDAASGAFNRLTARITQRTATSYEG